MGAEWEAASYIIKKVGSKSDEIKSSVNDTIVNAKGEVISQITSSQSLITNNLTGLKNSFKNNEMPIGVPPSPIAGLWRPEYYESGSYMDAQLISAMNPGFYNGTKLSASTESFDSTIKISPPYPSWVSGGGYSSMICRPVSIEVRYKIQRNFTGTDNLEHLSDRKDGTYLTTLPIYHQRVHSGSTPSSPDNTAMPFTPVIDELDVYYIFGFFPISEKGVYQDWCPTSVAVTKHMIYSQDNSQGSPCYYKYATGGKGY